MKFQILIALLLFSGLKAFSQDNRNSFGIDAIFSIHETGKKGYEPQDLGNMNKKLDEFRGKMVGFGLIAERRMTENTSLNTGLYFSRVHSESGSTFQLNTYCEELGEPIDMEMKLTEFSQLDFLRLPVKFNYYYSIYYFSGGFIFDYNLKNRILDYTLTRTPDINCGDIEEPSPAYDTKMFYTLEFNVGLNFWVFDTFNVNPSVFYNLRLDLAEKSESNNLSTINSYNIGFGVKIMY